MLEPVVLARGVLTPDSPAPAASAPAVAAKGSRGPSGGELRIGLAADGIALLHRAGGWRKRSALLGVCTLEAAQGLAADHGLADQVAATLHRLLRDADCQRMPVRLVLADAWARHWMVTPPSNASRLADCRAAAEWRFQTLFDEPMAGWQLAADWQARQPFLASALPVALLAALRQVAAEHRLVLLDVLPQFVAGWNRWCRTLEDGAWFGVVSGEVLTLGAVSGRRLHAVRSLALSPDLDAAGLRLALQREALRQLLDMPSALRLCGAVPAAWTAPGPAGWACSRLDAELDAGQGAMVSSPQALAALHVAATGVR